jgi:nucleotide-binding universal stress UspA family protein
MTEFDSTGRIVVGVDGSPCSQIALSWAARLAAAETRQIDVVAAWEYPANYGWTTLPEDETLKEAMEKTATDVVDAVFGPQRPAGLRVILHEAHPAEALIRHSAGAYMVVVGSRGHGGFAGLLLGSVSARVAERAKCPVLVVHEPRLTSPEERPEAAPAAAASEGAS